MNRIAWVFLAGIVFVEPCWANQAPPPPPNPPVTQPQTRPTPQPNAPGALVAGAAASAAVLAGGLWFARRERGR